MPLSSDDAPALQFRSGAVARMLRMPVSTLRVWERRYGLSAPAGASAGHRLYSAEDVRRLALMRQLTEQGHAIGDLAGLPWSALQAMAATHVQHAQPPSAPPAASIIAAVPAPVPSPGAGPASRASAVGRAPRRPWQVRVDGAGLWERLQDPTVRQGLALPLEATLCQGTDAAHRLAPDAHADALLVHAPTLHEGAARALREAAAAWAPRPVAVMVGFGPTAHVEALEAAGIAVCRQTLDDRTLARWLASVAQRRPEEAAAPERDAQDDAVQAGSSRRRVPPRRYDDATLARVAGISTTVACECPKHVAELLMQLTAFEHYSAECQSLTPQDAALHASLQQVAAQARAMFEAALEAVARHEGIELPTPPGVTGRVASTRTRARTRRPAGGAAGND
jgi:MerR family transcriptional regulator, light-induced transcriptional regulator